MIGSNEITLNKDTVKTAIEYYLRTEVFAVHVNFTVVDIIPDYTPGAMKVELTFEEEETSKTEGSDVAE